MTGTVQSGGVPREAGGGTGTQSARRRRDRPAVDHIDRTDRHRRLGRRGPSRDRLLGQRRTRHEHEREWDEGRAHAQSPLRQSADDVAPSRTDERSGDGESTARPLAGTRLLVGDCQVVTDCAAASFVARSRCVATRPTTTAAAAASHTTGNRSGTAFARSAPARSTTAGNSGCTRAVHASKLSEPGAKLVVGAHQRVSSEASSRARAFLPRS